MLSADYYLIPYRLTI